MLQDPAWLLHHTAQCLFRKPARTLTSRTPPTRHPTLPVTRTTRRRPCPWSRTMVTSTSTTTKRTKPQPWPQSKDPAPSSRSRRPQPSLLRPARHPTPPLTLHRLQSLHQGTRQPTEEQPRPPRTGLRRQPPTEGHLAPPDTDPRAETPPDMDLRADSSHRSRSLEGVEHMVGPGHPPPMEVPGGLRSQLLLLFLQLLPGGPGGIPVLLPNHHHLHCQREGSAEKTAQTAVLGDIQPERETTLIAL